MIDSLPKGGEGGLYTVHDAPVAPLGECFFNNEDNTKWLYLKADVAIAQGEALKSKALTVVTTGLVAGGAPAGGHTITDADGGFIAALVRVPSNGAKFRENAVIVVYVGEGKGQRGTILKYTDTELTVYWHGSDDGTLKTALDATSGYQIFVPWLVQLATAASGVIAFAQVDAALGQYIWGQVEGEGWCLAGAAVTAANDLSIDTTDGHVKNYAAADAHQIVGSSLAAAADGDLCYAHLHAPAKLAKVPDVGKTGPYIQSYQHPTL